MDDKENYDDNGGELGWVVWSLRAEVDRLKDELAKTKLKLELFEQEAESANDAAIRLAKITRSMRTAMMQNTKVMVQGKPYWPDWVMTIISGPVATVVGETPWE